MWHENVLGTIGGTPLVRLSRLGSDLAPTILAKVEYFNPGGSVKDRIAVRMIDDAEEKGLLKPGGTIIEGTSGNTGAGLALTAIARGYRCIFTTTDKQSKEKIDVLRGLGAEVQVCPTNVKPDDPRSYYSVARRLAEQIPNSIYVNQYDNPANTQAHYETTGPELWEQTEGRITHFFAGAGTGGTISGVSRYLKEHNPNIRAIGVDPFGSVYYKYFHTHEFDESEIYPYITEGVGEDILARNMDFDLVDDYVQVSDRDAMIFTRRLAREEGLFAGGSSGMVVAGALDWMASRRAEMKDDDVAVILIPDSGFRYLSKIYNDTWMRNHGFYEETARITIGQILSKLKRDATVIFVDIDDSLAAAIARMSSNSISQMPVMEDGKAVGSLTESGILNLLITQPDARDRKVREVMAPPLPVVPKTIPLEQLYTHLDSSSGAVMIYDETDDCYEIITRSDLISSLAELGRDNPKNGTK